MNPARFARSQRRHPLIAHLRKGVLRRLAVQRGLQREVRAEAGVQYLHAEPDRLARDKCGQVFDQQIRLAVTIEIRLLRIDRPTVRRGRDGFRRQESPHRTFPSVRQPDVAVPDAHGVSARSSQLRRDFIRRGIDARNRDSLLRNPQGSFTGGDISTGARNAGLDGCNHLHGARIDLGDRAGSLIQSPHKAFAGRHEPGVLIHWYFGDHLVAGGMNHAHNALGGAGNPHQVVTVDGGKRVLWNLNLRDHLFVAGSMRETIPFGSLGIHAEPAPKAMPPSVLAGPTGTFATTSLVLRSMR